MVNRHPQKRHSETLTQAFWIAVLAVFGAVPQGWAGSPTKLDMKGYEPSCGIEIEQKEEVLRVSWPMGRGRSGKLAFNLSGTKPHIGSIAVAEDPNSSPQTIAEGLDPVLILRVGKRDLAKRDGWTIFFDRMQEKPHEVYEAELSRTRVAVSSRGNRATVSLGEVTAGPFKGELRWTFFCGSPFVLQEAVISTQDNAVAYLYDTGLVCRETIPQAMTWHDSPSTLQTRAASHFERGENLAVHGRSVCADFAEGSIALFPPPHRYFYPLDFSDNLRNIWIGPEYAERPLPFGFGIRHDPQGDNRFVPWFNAPPSSSQHLGVFLLLSNESPEYCLEEVSALTRGDRFKPLPRHKVFSSHFHVEHTRELLEVQEDATIESESSIEGQLPGGDTYVIPKRLQVPGFVKKFRELGIDAVHLAEFHFGHTPRMKMPERMQHLEVLHAECRRLSDEGFLLLPGEEPNVHLGGHWISFFPQPVYWVLNRPEGTPFVSDHPQLGKVYHVGSEADVLRLLKAEHGLAWTAHPRIKGSTGFPDAYRRQLFFTSDRFLGAAWKAMPADLSQPRLGTRVLDLLDDMSNWGDSKFVLGEADVFKIEPDHELYGHMNVNYLHLDELPKFEDGWQPILDALRGGRFFVTTGEVLIPEFTVNGTPSGEIATLSSDGRAAIQLELQWTFPLDRIEIIHGNGQGVQRQAIDQSHTQAYGEETLTLEVDLRAAKWVRVEVWDVATNGAFTQPVWLQQP